MKEITFTSKTHGSYTTIVNDTDYERLKLLKTMTWAVVKKRGHIYFSKKITGIKKRIELHRFIMGDPVGKYVDHVSGNTLDNTRKNLRVCSNATNLRNATHIRPNNTSGKSGVWFAKRINRWSAEIKVNYKKIFLGTFKKFEDAVKAREKAEIKYFNA
jgi:hypothetical protein